MKNVAQNNFSLFDSLPKYTSDTLYLKQHLKLYVKYGQQNNKAVNKPEVLILF